MADGLEITARMVEATCSASGDLYDQHMMTQHGIVTERAKMKAEITTLRAQLAACDADRLEQARLNGMGGEREARLMAEVSELKRAIGRAMTALKPFEDHSPHMGTAWPDSQQLSMIAASGLNYGHIRQAARAAAAIRALAADKEREA